MGRNKTYKLDQNEKMMVEVFKNAIQENLHKQLYLISHEFKYEVGENIKDSKKDITILDNFYKKNKRGKNNK